jgi:hypothetical protein
MQSVTHSITQSFAAAQVMPRFALYDEAGNVIEMHYEQAGEFKEW